MELVQGGIIAGKGRGRKLVLVLFRFERPNAIDSNRATVRSAATRITTAYDLYERVGKGVMDQPAVSFFLTAKGLAACDIRPESRDGGIFFPKLDNAMLPQMNEGTHARVLGDDLGTWQKPDTEGIDGAWQIAQSDPKVLSREVRRTKEWCRTNALSVVKTECGSVPDDGREPFGFLDGLATQRFFRRGVRDPLPATLSDVFLSGPTCFGSTFLVYRKLEQNVRAFRHFTAVQGLREAERLVGRDLERGRPLAPGTPARLNNFDFSNDARGASCPFHAHIRRANPRGVVTANGSEPMHRPLPMVRRGVVYGSKRQLRSPEGAAQGVGLLFMAYMADLKNFITIQASWMTLEHFPAASDPQFPSHGHDMLMFGPPEGTCPGVSRWITPRAGAYFFVPSKRWLQNL